MMLYTPVVPRGRCKKLMCPWSGPYKILKKTIGGCVQNYIAKEEKRLVVHFNRF